MKTDRLAQRTIPTGNNTCLVELLLLFVRSVKPPGEKDWGRGAVLVEPGLGVAGKSALFVRDPRFEIAQKQYDLRISQRSSHQWNKDEFLF